ncbi:MAG TPA: HlyD family secretion protein [Tepidisphaeraceae bacterium]|jgi:membrane fusion protein (multidrug efflux system)|nr:HlyD family secretion protein [Tepidisphaeraceae bacterium]
MSRAPAEPQAPDRTPPDAEHSGPGNGANQPPAILNPQGRPVEPVAERRPWYRRRAVLIFAGVVLIVLLGGVVYWWFFAHGHETTDDAFVEADVTNVSPQVAGHVIKLGVEDNRIVEQGKLVVQIDPTDFDIALNNAKTQLEVAQGQLAQAQSQVLVYEAQVKQNQADVATAEANDWQAHTDLSRYERLSKEAVSQQTLDQSIAAARVADANLKSAQQKQVAAESQVKYAQSQVKTAGAQVAEADVAVRNAQQQLDYTTVNAPITGTVTDRTANVGDYVQVGQALLALVPKQAYVIANFKETQLAHMRPGQPVKMHIDSFPGQTFYGHVDSIERGTGSVFSLLPPENATGNYVKVVQRVPVKIVFDNLPANIRLAPGMSVEPDVNVK